MGNTFIAFYYVVWISFMLCGFLAWYFSHKAKHEERKLLIQQGMDVREPSRKESNRMKFPWLKLGVIIIGLSIGMGIIAVLANLELLGHSDAIYLAILGMCGGISLVVAYYIDRDKKQA